MRSFTGFVCCFNCHSTVTDWIRAELLFSWSFIHFFCWKVHVSVGDCCSWCLWWLMGELQQHMLKPKGNALVFSIDINQYMGLAHYRANSFKAIFTIFYIFSYFHKLPLIAFIWEIFLTISGWFYCKPISIFYARQYMYMKYIFRLIYCKPISIFYTLQYIHMKYIIRIFYDWFVRLIFTIDSLQLFMFPAIRLSLIGL